MNSEEIRLRQLAGQHLIEPTDKLAAVHDLCGIQAQFMSNAFHSLKIRCSNFDEETAGDGLVKNWTVRGTVHVFAEDDLPLFVHCGDKYRSNDWTGSSFWNQREVWRLTPERQSLLTDVILNALKDRSLTRDELKQICRDNGMTPSEEDNMFDQWGGGIREMCERGFMNYVVQQEKAFCLSPEFEPMPEKQAQLELARRYFTNIAPATIHDAMYFFRTSAKQVKEWINELPVTAVECGGKTYYYIESGRDCGEIPRCLFLAGFDQLMLGYEKKESLYLAAEHLRGIFNLAGIVMPAVMLNGAVVGRWKKKGGTLSVDLFREVSTDDLRAVKEKAESLWSDIKKLNVFRL